MKSKRRECMRPGCLNDTRRGGHVTPDGGAVFCSMHTGLNSDRHFGTRSRSIEQLAFEQQRIVNSERIDAILRERYPKERARRELHNAQRTALQVRGNVEMLHVARQLNEEERELAERQHAERVGGKR